MSGGPSKPPSGKKRQRPPPTGKKGKKPARPPPTGKKGKEPANPPTGKKGKEPANPPTGKKGKEPQEPDFLKLFESYSNDPKTLEETFRGVDRTLLTLLRELLEKFINKTDKIRHNGTKDKIIRESNAVDEIMRNPESLLNDDFNECLNDRTVFNFTFNAEWNNEELQILCTIVMLIYHAKVITILSGLGFGEDAARLFERNIKAQIGEAQKITNKYIQIMDSYDSEVESDSD